MSNDLNQCNFIGRLGKDPEVRYMTNGDAVASFAIAVGWKTKEKEGAEWVPVTAFGQLAEICGKYLVKGSRVFVSGRFTTRKWQDKDGNDRYTTEIKAEKMQMLDGKPSEPQERKPDPAQHAAGGDLDDDIPFLPIRGVLAMLA